MVCIDEMPRQLIHETSVPVPMRSGQPSSHNYECCRCGTCYVLIATEPLDGKKMTKETERRTRIDWA